jgi:uncharacterized protein YcfJ
MMQKILACFTLMAVLSGCASAPTGPRVAVMPAPGKPFELFVAEEKTCRDYAEQSIGQSRNDAAAKNFVGAVVVGTAIGAAAGALGGGDHGNSAATGMLAGSMIGAGESANASGDAQRRYDIAYEQCMYAKGNQIPGYAAPRQTYLPPPPPQ